MMRSMSYREVAKIADQITKKDRYEALQIARGKAPIPGSVRPVHATAFDAWLCGGRKAA